MAERVLCLMAHPDDETLRSGGSLALYASAGHAVRVVVVTDGVGARHPAKDQFFEADRLQRRQAFGAACKALGVESADILNLFPDQQADTIPQLAINQRVAYEVETFRPTIVFTHWPSDLNIDHRRVAEAVLVATRSGPYVLCAEPEFPARAIGQRFRGKARINITQQIDTKLFAAQAYATELREFPHPRSIEGLRARAKRHGTFGTYAEAFHAVSLSDD